MNNDKPARVVIADLNTLEEMAFQYNPSEVDESLTSNWEWMAAMGSTDEHGQHTGTEGMPISFGLEFDSMTPGGSKLMDARNFLLSLCYARSNVQGIPEAAPNALLLWPNLYSVSVRVLSVTNKFTRFANGMRPTLLTSQISLKRWAGGRIYPEMVRQYGTL